MPDIIVDAQDYRAVAVAQSQQLVTLQAIQSSLNRELAALKAEHAKCAKPAAADKPAA